jgi:hypothetical protein
VSFVMFEAVVVGLCLILAVYAVKFGFQVTGLQVNQTLVLFASGFLFHVVFEYTGINLWYSIKYCELTRVR